MSSIIYTSTSSKLSKKQRAAREELLKQQRSIKRELKTLQQKSAGSIVGRPSVYIRDHDVVESRGTGMGVAPLKSSPVYTGTKMIGIGQMHKSNAVPVFREEEAKELASMRR